VSLSECQTIQTGLVLRVIEFENVLHWLLAVPVVLVSPFSGDFDTTVPVQYFDDNIHHHASSSLLFRRSVLLFSCPFLLLRAMYVVCLLVGSDGSIFERAVCLLFFTYVPVLM
jgi:hypothetical protein